VHLLHVHLLLLVLPASWPSLHPPPAVLLLHLLHQLVLLVLPASWPSPRHLPAVLLLLVALPVLPASCPSQCHPPLHRHMPLPTWQCQRWWCCQSHVW
jgi:hypothetical protein